MHDVSFVPQLLGKPWISGARGPDSFDCWGVLFWIYSEHLRISVPEYPGIDASNAGLTETLMTEAAEGDGWIALDAPMHVCTVTMSRTDRVGHVGMFLDVDGGLVLHCQRGVGVVIHSISDLKHLLRFSQLGWFRPVNMPVALSLHSR